MLTAVALGLAILAPTVVLGAVFAMPRWFAAATEAHRRRRRRLGQLDYPTGPPIERLAADLRRLRLERAITHRSRVQREGVRQAYEEVLQQAALALGISHRLAGTRGLEREVELLRVEQALLDAGMLLAT